MSSISQYIYTYHVARNKLSPEQAEEYQSLLALLPQLVKSIERGEENKKERIAWEARKAARVERERLAAEAEKLLRSSKNRPDVGQKDDFEKPNLTRTSSIAGSDATMFENSERAEREVFPGEIVSPFVDVDRRSLYSIDSMDDR